MAFQDIIDEIVFLHDKKRKDYGQDNDPYANIRAGSKFIGVPDVVGCLMRMNDKMFRLSAWCHGSTMVNESVEDSLIDLAVYAIIALDLIREEEHGND